MFDNAWDDFASRREDELGTNRRYAESLDNRAQLRELGRLIADGAKPDSLHRVETDLAVEPVTTPPSPLPVRVWLRVAAGAYVVDALAHRWTSRAVAVEVRLEGIDEPLKVWVWASAVRARGRQS